MTETQDSRVQDYLEATDKVVARNYSPLDVILTSGSGVEVTDITGKTYLDFLAGYSALNFGHGNADIIAAAQKQLSQLTLTSRAFHSDKLLSFAQKLAELVGKDMVLPMNTGAEAVETGIKVARKWGYEVKGVADNQANIIVANGNFHGRTSTIISFSDDPVAHDNYGPYMPGFRKVPFGDGAALEAAIDENTVAVLLEPIQGEAGVNIPPRGYFADVRRITSEHNVLLIADEIQSGLGRTGTTLALEHEGITPDVILLGKALGGGVVPVSAVAADAEVLGVLKPGQHGSTFGGNPLAAAVGEAVVDLLATGEYQRRATEMGEVLGRELDRLVGSGVVGYRRRGLWAGVDIDPQLADGHTVCIRLADKGVLAKDTHGSTIRLAPPIVISEDQIVQGIRALGEVLAELK